MSEKAIGYFERASLMQPDEVKWRLMIASCYRRSGNYHKGPCTCDVRKIDGFDAPYSAFGTD